MAYAWECLSFLKCADTSLKDRANTKGQIPNYTAKNSILQ